MVGDSYVSTFLRTLTNSVTILAFVGILRRVNQLAGAILVGFAVVVFASLA